MNKAFSLTNCDVKVDIFRHFDKYYYKKMHNKKVTEIIFPSDQSDGKSLSVLSQLISRNFFSVVREHFSLFHNWQFDGKVGSRKVKYVRRAYIYFRRLRLIRQKSGIQFLELTLNTN